MVILVVPPVCGSYVIILSNWTPVYERVVVKNGHQEGPCYNEIGLNQSISKIPMDHID